MDLRRSNETPNSFQFFNRLNIIDWIALIAPYIISIVLYKYNEDDKTSNIGFLDFLVVLLILAIIIRFYPFFSRNEKTGRSFQSQYGKLEEYTTVEGKINTEQGWWIVSLIHIIVVILILKFHGFGTSEIDSNAVQRASEQNNEISLVKIEDDAAYLNRDDAGNTETNSENDVEAQNTGDSVTNQDVPTSYKVLEYRSYYDNGELQVVGYKDSEGRLQGIFKAYYQNGQLQNEFNYLNGENIGESKMYYNNGQLSYYSNYSNPTTYDVKTFYENGIPKSIIHVRENSPNGEQKEYYEDGRVKKISNYSNGTLISEKKFD